MGYKNFKNNKNLLKIPNNPPLLAKILRIAIPPKNIFFGTASWVRRDFEFQLSGMLIVRSGHNTV